MFMVAGCNDQCTEGDEGVRGKYARFMTNSAKNRILSSNVMTS